MSTQPAGDLTAYNMHTTHGLGIPFGSNKADSTIGIYPGRYIFEQIGIGVDNIRPIYRLASLIQGDSRPVWNTATELQQHDEFNLAAAFGFIETASGLSIMPGGVPTETVLQEGEGQDAQAQQEAVLSLKALQLARELFNEDIDPEEGAPFTSDWITKRYLVDGDMLAYRPLEDDGTTGAIQWLDQLVMVTPDMALQRFDIVPPEEMGSFYDYETNPKAIMRRFQRGPDDPDVITITFEKYTKNGIEDALEDAIALVGGKENASTMLMAGQVDSAEIFFFPFGRGILFHPGRAIMRLLEIQETLRDDDKAERLRTASGASQYGNATQNLRDAMEAGDRVVGTPENINLQSHADSTHSTMLLDDKKQLRQDVAEVTHTMALDGPIDISGAALRLLMQDMQTYCKQARRDISKVYRAFGGRMEWAPLIVSEASDRVADRDLFLSTLAIINKMAPGAVPIALVLRRLKSYLL